MRKKKLIKFINYATGGQLYAETQGGAPIAGATYIWFNSNGRRRFKYLTRLPKFRWKSNEKKKNN